ncbi:MAG TPA: ester cyclase [Polyangiaceae bacterium]|nr:ester cyclase [Polyangiaceae bacterium]
MNDERTARESVIRRYYDELWNEGRLELTDELLAPTYVNHSPGSPEQDRGREGVRAVVAAMRTAFPDLRYEIEDLVVGDDSVAVRTTVTGTHEGDFFGLAPTGRRFCVSQICVERFSNGKIVAHHRLTDELALLRQLGALPAG